MRYLLFSFFSGPCSSPQRATERKAMNVNSSPWTSRWLVLPCTTWALRLWPQQQLVPIQKLSRLKIGMDSAEMRYKNESIWRKPWKYRMAAGCLGRNSWKTFGLFRFLAMQHPSGNLVAAFGCGSSAPNLVVEWTLRKRPLNLTTLGWLIIPIWLWVKKGYLKKAYWWKATWTKTCGPQGFSFWPIAISPLVDEFWHVPRMSPLFHGYPIWTPGAGVWTRSLWCGHHTLQLG